ncbi:MAG: EpsG family protein [Chitinophaga sp.]|uniref:EpsG family protein n=1 Tax=Chitinophaga sp. TaxID=1869181 RepID=UPI001B18EA88|nr:EpsG family protein [Chitinophaga sp.]MBO9732310.1 EpsG family protein [Chitinophaga sp.]
MQVFFWEDIVGYLFAFFLALLYVLKLDIRRWNDKGFDNLIVGVIVAYIVLVFGSRSADVGKDTAAYIDTFNRVAGMGNLTLALQGVKGDLLFYVFTYICSRFFSAQIYLALMVVLLMWPVTAFTYRITATKRSLLLLTFVSFFFFQAIGINIIRNGVALGFTILYFGMHRKEDTWKKILCAVVASFFHLSVVAIFLADLAIRKIKDIRLYYVLLAVVSVAAYMGFGFNNIPFVSELVSLDRISGYTDNLNDYKVGFRIDFWAFNMIFVVIGHFGNRLEQNEFYTRIFKLYLVMTAVFYLCFNIAFSDRFGLLSWIFIPVILFYPMLKMRAPAFKHFYYLIFILAMKLFSITFFK